VQWRIGHPSAIASWIKKIEIPLRLLAQQCDDFSDVFHGVNFSR
jgi:hypothetical protein